MTILTFSTGGARKTRRCDSICHNAKHDECRCICGGRYHGKGVMAAEQLTRDLLAEDWHETRAQFAEAGGSVMVARALQQLHLPDAPPPGGAV